MSRENRELMWELKEFVGKNPADALETDHRFAGRGGTPVLPHEEI